MANLATSLTFSSSSSPSLWILKHKSPSYCTFKQLHSFHSSFHFDYTKLVSLRHNHGERFPVLFTVLDNESALTEEAIVEGDVKSEGSLSNQEVKKLARPCELYVCNLPRSCDIAELVEMFKPYGTVLAAEVDTIFCFLFSFRVFVVCSFVLVFQNNIFTSISVWNFLK